MKKTQLQKVDLQDVINKLVTKAEDGDAYTSAGRGVGLIDTGDRLYSVGIVVTCDEDEFTYDDSLPILDSDIFRAGKGVIRAPEGHLPSSEPYED